MTADAGAFSWVGLLTAEFDRAMRFYGQLFDWTADSRSTPDGRGYSVMHLNGEPVALMYEIADWQRELGAPANWATFVSVDDVEATAALAVELGGGVAIPPYEVDGAARIAPVTGPAGARISLWQPLADLAPQRAGEIGTCCWNELAAPDPDAAEPFYAGLFGWELDREPTGYRIISNRGFAQGGIRALGPREPDRPDWVPYFRVGSVGDTIARLTQAGGRVGEPPCDGPVAILSDREGARFGVCARLPSGSGADACASVAGARDPEA
jgi:uncharacterized protein